MLPLNLRDHYQTIRLADGREIPGSRSLRRLNLIRWDDVRDVTVLDVGCNNGAFALEAARRGARKVIAVEKLPCIRLAKELAAAEHLSIDFIEEDIESADLRARIPEVQVVFFFAMLNHMKDKAATLAWLDRITERHLYYETNFENKKEQHLAFLRANTTFTAYRDLGESGDKPGQYHMYCGSRDQRDWLRAEWGICPAITLDPNAIHIAAPPNLPQVRAHIDRVKQSIQRLGLRRPILIVKEKNRWCIREGGHRLLAARELGIEVSCRIIPYPNAVDPAATRMTMAERVQQ